MKIPRLLLFLLTTGPIALAEDLEFAGTLANSGGSGETRVTFAGEVASGMGPVIDDVQTLWERGGSRQVNRFALDGRNLPHSSP